MKHITSYFINEQELIKSIIQVHNDGKDIECDPMYFKGNFWKNGLNKPKYKFIKSLIKPYKKPFIKVRYRARANL